MHGVEHHVQVHCLLEQIENKLEVSSAMMPEQQDHLNKGAAPYVIVKVKQSIHCM